MTNLRGENATPDENNHNDAPHTRLSMSRRAVLAGAAGFTLVHGAGLHGAFAKAPMIGTQAPAFYRFKIGGFEATIVSDGPLQLGPVKAELFGGLTQDGMVKALSEQFLPTDNLSLEQNVLVLNTGDQIVIFDTGTGGAKMFGEKSGRLLANLKFAGIDPAQVDAVVLSHTHPDHCWGLMQADGTPAFANAKVFVAESDLQFWTDEGKLNVPMIGGMIGPTRKALLPLRERMTFLKDGAEVVPGVQAMSAPGHTVGHTVFVVTSNGQSLVVTADLAHHHVLIMENPKTEFAFDTDPKQGVASRIRVFDMVAANRLPVISYHFPWPGLGHIAKHGDGYRFIPASLSTTL